VGSVFVDTSDPETLRTSLTDRTRLVFVETISNPAMKLCDLARIAEIAHEGGALLVVDNTFATPALCRPLEHGADLVGHSATKFIGGHHDLTAGVVVGRKTLVERIRRCAYLYGPTLGSMDAWLALRGIKTLAPRMAWISETATAVAAYLAAHPAIAAVRYPGLPDHPQAVLAQRLLPDGAGGMLAFDLAGGPSAAEALIRSLRTIAFAPSLGGTGTTVSYPPTALPAGNNVREPSAVVRMSVGLEAAADLIADLRQALAVYPVPEMDAALKVSA
jgi:methionine-gamma-lyase